MFYILSVEFLIVALFLMIALSRYNRRRGNLSSKGYLGLKIALGILIFLSASWPFAVIAENVMSTAPLTAVDRDIVQWLDVHRTPGLTTALLIITNLASAFWVVCATVATGLILWRKHCLYRLLALILVVPGGVVQIPLLKMIFQRPRPGIELAYLNFQGYSFPSGHAITATLLYGLLGVLAVLALKGWWAKIWVMLAAVAMVLLVSFSRMYLGAHYLSDVLAGIAAGIAWLALSLTAVEVLRNSRSH